MRSGYADSSRDFADWVNSLGLEKTWWGRFLAYLETRFQFQRFSIIFVYCLFLSSIVYFDMNFSYVGYELGSVVPNDVKSPVAIEIVDEEQTKIELRKAESVVSPVFDFDPVAIESLTDRVYKSFEFIRSEFSQRHSGSLTPEQIKAFLPLKKSFEDRLGRVALANSNFEWLTSKRFDISIENALIALLEEFSGQRIAENLDGLASEGRSEVRVRIFQGESGFREITVPLLEIRDLGQLRERILTARGSYLRSAFDDRQLRRMAQNLLVPNLRLNMREWEQRRRKAREALPPKTIQIRRNSVAIAQGTTIGPVQLRILESIEKAREGRKSGFQILMLAGLLLSVILVFTSFLRRFTLNRVVVSNKDMWAMGLITIIVVVIAKFTSFLSDSGIAESLTALVPRSAFAFLVPLAAGPMLVGLVVASGEVVWIYSVFEAIVLSFQSDAGFSFLIVAIASGLAGARGVFNCRKRNDIYWAGVRAGLVAALGATFITLTREGFSLGRADDMAWVAGFGLVSGVLSSMVALMLIPIIESVFSYTTDVRLLELGNLNHPLLKDMIVRAPGTYHHSLVVGSMVEAAAEEIGANPLLAKVSSYYHDIGKTEHAAYFIENQRTGHNPHDDLSPYMSKTILIAHVKDGVELATKYKLGKPIQDVIVQHHGTTLISFFYNRAKERMESEGGDEPPQEEFRYPGPKPQFREAALCMLADSIEAAARSLDEPTPARLQNIVKNIIQRKFVDGQLEECNLTLRDLSIIEEAFIRVLLGIYHQRIDYPRSAGGGASETPKKPLSAV